MGKRNLKLRKRRLDSRVEHIRYNWEFKPREMDDINHESEHTVKFTFVVLAKDPRAIADKIVNQIRQYGSGLELVMNTFPQLTGDNGFRYVLRVVEANVKPSEIDWTKYELPFKMDSQLREQPRITLEDYVSRKYPKN
jgi:hypothetical protein